MYSHKWVTCGDRLPIKHPMTVNAHALFLQKKGSCLVMGVGHLGPL